MCTLGNDFQQFPTRFANCILEMQELYEKYQRYRRLRHHQRTGISSTSRITIRRIAARRTGVQFRSLPNHDASGFAVAGAFPLQRPHFRTGRSVLRARRVREFLHHANVFVVLALLHETGIVGRDVVDAEVAVFH